MDASQLDLIDLKLNACKVLFVPYILFPLACERTVAVFILLDSEACLLVKSFFVHKAPSVAFSVHRVLPYIERMTTEIWSSFIIAEDGIFPTIFVRVNDPGIDPE